MILIRRYKDTHTEGKLIFPDGSYVYTLERPDLNNKPNISCIPEGEYLVDRDKTGRFQWYRFRNVHGRSHIEIHPANKVDQLMGCVAPCMKLVDGVGYNSKAACEKLLEWIGDNSFVLTIRRYNSFKDGKW